MALKQAISRDFSRIASCFGSCLGLALALAGCSETAGQGPLASSAQAVANVIQPSGFSPRPATLAVTQTEGAPDALQSQYMALFNADVAARDVALTDQAGARYLARGYISAFPVDGGARLTYVWDIFDRTNHRAQRLNDEIALKGSAPDPWSLVDAAAISALAARSANDLAAYLSNTPEAMAAAVSAAPAQATNASQVVQPAASAPQAAPSQALSYTSPR
jgi:hypothetical protein